MLHWLSAVLGAVVFYLLYNKVKVLVLWFFDILKSTSLIAGLAFNDFKMKYAASYLGTIWAFIQPIVTVSIYILVFGYGFKSSPVSDVPFALWLTAGIVPWFFFQDAWIGATNSLFEYSYLVKKVVFKISALPIVKMLSAIFVHIFFTVLAIVLYKVFGYPIKITILQTIYYTFCILVLTLGLSYITSACVVFFRDISQVLMIILQFGMWLTPIMWSSDMFGAKVERVLMLNPMYYVVQGYRDAFYEGAWFWDKPKLSIYFWVITLIIMVMGIKVFKKLEKHFADVL
ncbi:MAG: ABC transporter permease [Lachnospiraceae bacterium]|nr:ABC transporter permease [Lachnospiraceae bacterium]